jgi:hypothetical protein
VRIDLIYTEAEREVRRTLERKWAQHEQQVAQDDRDHPRVRPVARRDGAGADARDGVERVEVSGEGYTLVNNDCVDETRRMADDSVDLIVTSIPFSTQYEYSPNYNDFGHTDNNEHFFEQMDFLTPELLRVLQPGRVAAIHVKDRIVPGGMTGLGFQTVYPFHATTHRALHAHGFAYLGMKTIVTDVVRENNQTYRLGWTEQCKDGSKMGVGMPEYLLLFRKPPTDRSNGYADVPVVKTRRSTRAPLAGRRARLRALERQPAADAGGDRRACRTSDLQAVPRALAADVYDFEHHVALGEALERKGILPVTFMLLQPQSWHPTCGPTSRACAR